MSFRLRSFWQRMRPSLLVVGGGGHGRVVMEAAILSGNFARVVVVDPMTYQSWSSSFAHCVKDEAEVATAKETWRFIPAVGSGVLRRQLFDDYATKGFEPVSVFHPASVVSPSARLGVGCAMLAGSIVGVEAVIGDGVIVNNGAIVEHDCKVGAFSHLAPGAVLAGSASLGDGSFLGANSCVRHGVSVGSAVVIGNGAVVARDIAGPGTFVGNPARRLPDTEKMAE